MTAPTPAVRAALVAAFVVVIVGVLAVVLHLLRVDHEAETAAARGVEARAATLAAALATDGSGGSLADRFDALASLDWPAGLALLDASGEIVSASDPAMAEVTPWSQAALTPGAIVVSRGDSRVAVAVRALGQSGQSLGVVQYVEPAGGTWGVLGIALALAALVLGAVAALAWYAGPRATAVLSVTAERMAANREGDPRTQVVAATRVLGPLATSLEPLANRLLAYRSDLSDASRQVAALLQINPHYVVIATFDGEIIEANPSFYAATGLSHEVVRGGSVDLLRDIFPLGPLLEVADRSDRENSSIQGIEYELVDWEGRQLPVLVSLRAVTVRRRKAVLIQATDVSTQKRLERQVAAFSDSLELMVDQRVAALSAGRTTLRQLIDRASVVLASFDAAGITIRWNGAAQTLTGRMQADAAGFHAAVATLGLTEKEAASLARWFWSDAEHPFVATSSFEVESGESVERRMVWRRVRNAEPGQTDSRTLVGVEVPDSLPIQELPAEAPRPSAIPHAPLASRHARAGGYVFEATMDEAPTPEAIAEEEAWIRRLSSDKPDAFGGGGRRRQPPPGGGTWVARGPGGDGIA
ncbi:PAS domain S-box protein [Rubricoccus marinus]|uniref:PAS domain-containing protein n=1 Tax=Rubricoccus marinus TaxID=716817 RepID=A0A259TVW4_9BACT|nr:PAS domain S-box protein [Rubricoccus marinus]OZC01912.1 hypothetical protein BSZ36_02260 [Rubricoccus marinus]